MTLVMEVYQLCKQVYLLAELVAAQQAGLPARQAGSSPASRSTCSPSGYQLSKQVYLLAELLYLLAGLVPAQQVGLPACRAGTSSASRSACSPSWYLYQPGKQVFTDLLAKSPWRADVYRPARHGLLASRSVDTSSPGAHGKQVVPARQELSVSSHWGVNTYTTGHGGVDTSMTEPGH
ncbi:hypothetical protein PCANC_26547 [Puccinia coronata f. sp. avenae]|uniref:Uncharacterized protein n=1 Tax=Puccinia coronata f. sp. avenae TaxID=200324 RepID=A0A2N5TJX9_9BASI|nr:hypothetical protein PCANC_26547 [Puccinia coronata f. sp. avenae]